MKFWEYCIHSCQDSGSEVEELVEMAARLGWNGVCVLQEKPSGKISPGNGHGMDFASGVVIEKTRPADLKREIMKHRMSREVIAVKANNDEAARTSLDMAEIDIILPGPDTEIDMVMARLARKNGICIAFELRHLVCSSGSARSRMLSWLRKNAKTVRKAGAPFVISSGALSPWDMRSPSEMTSFGKILGFGDPAIKKALGGGLIAENRKRLGGKWVMPGVEIV